MKKNQSWGNAFSIIRKIISELRQKVRGKRVRGRMRLGRISMINSANEALFEKLSNSGDYGPPPPTHPKKIYISKGGKVEEMLLNDQRY